MGTLSGTHFSVPLRKIIAPSGQAYCMWVPHGGAHIFRSVPLRDYFSLRAPPGPLMGTLSGTHVGTLSGTHFSKTKIIILAFRAPHVPDHTYMPPPADTTAHSHLICS